MSLVQEIPKVFLLTNELQKIPNRVICSRFRNFSKVGKVRNFSMEKILKETIRGGIAPERHQTSPKGKIEQYNSFQRKLAKNCSLKGDIKDDKRCMKVYEIVKICRQDYDKTRKFMTKLYKIAINYTKIVNFLCKIHQFYTKI